MDGKVKVALCQTYIEWEDKETNITSAEGYIKQAAENGAELILFPEMSFTGFSMDISVTRESDPYTIERMKEFAVRYKAAIGFGWVHAVGDKAENRYCILDHEGRILADYSKIHSFRYGGECDQFVSGNVISSFEYKGLKFTPFICYDLRVPEIFRAVNDDTDVYIVPANWPARRSMHWKTLLQARAIENQAYVLGINCAGSIGELEYSGDSSAIAPDGTVMDMISDREGIIFVDIDRSVLGIRDSFPVLEDRKKDLYSRLGGSV